MVGSLFILFFGVIGDEIIHCELPEECCDDAVNLDTKKKMIVISRDL